MFHNKSSMLVSLISIVEGSLILRKHIGIGSSQCDQALVIKCYQLYRGYKWPILRSNASFTLVDIFSDTCYTFQFPNTASKICIIETCSKELFGTTDYKTVDGCANVSSLNLLTRSWLKRLV